MLPVDGLGVYAVLKFKICILKLQKKANTKYIEQSVNITVFLIYHDPYVWQFH